MRSGKHLPLTCLVALLLPLLGVQVHGWNETGHMAASLIAFRALKPATRARVIKALENHPSFASWKGDRDPGAEETQAHLFMKASVWPDDIRSATHPENKEHRFKDHFINLPFSTPADHPLPKGKGRAEILEDDQIVKRLTGAVALLRSADAEPARKARELAWIFHLVGDIHQS